MNKILLVIIIVLAVGLVGWFYLGQLHAPLQNSTINNSSSTSSSSSAVITPVSSTDNVYVSYCYDDLPLGNSGPLVSPAKTYSASLYVDQSTGAGHVDYNLEVTKVNSSNGTIFVKTPPISTPGYNNGSGTTDIDVISSYAWNDDTSLNITSYVVYEVWNDAAKTFSYNRVSPVEVWQYDLSSGTYTFVKDLPEPATPLTCQNS